MAKRRTHTPEEIAELEAARDAATRKAHEACATARPIKAGGRTFRPEVIKLAHNPASGPVPLADVLAWTCNGLAVHPCLSGVANLWQITHTVTGLRVAESYLPGMERGPGRLPVLERAARILEAFDGWATLSPDDREAMRKARDAVRYSK